MKRFYGIVLGILMCAGGWLYAGEPPLAFPPAGTAKEKIISALEGLSVAYSRGGDNLNYIARTLNREYIAPNLEYALDMVNVVEKQPQFQLKNVSSNYFKQLRDVINQEIQRLGSRGAQLPPPSFGPPPPPPGQAQAPVPPQREFPWKPVAPPPVPPRTMMPVRPGVEIAGRYKKAIMNTFDALISGLVKEDDKKMAQGFKDTLRKAYTEQNLTNMMNVWLQQLSGKLMRSGNQTFSSTKMVDSLQKLIATELNAQKKK